MKEVKEQMMPLQWMELFEILFKGLLIPLFTHCHKHKRVVRLSLLNINIRVLGEYEERISRY